MPRSLNGTLETILVVDNDETVLEAVVLALERANFHVLSARGGVDAINLAEETPGEIDLLLSDVDVPQMSGPDLGQALKMTRPNIHVMLMSGRENGNLLVLNYGWAYIQKPLVAIKLVQMVKAVLHSADRSQLGGQEFDSSKDTGHVDMNQVTHLPVRTTIESDDTPKALPPAPRISRRHLHRRPAAKSRTF